MRRAVTNKTTGRRRYAWAYVSGLVSALETRLLNQRSTLELLDAQGLGELLGRVRQTYLFADIPETREPFALAESMQACYAAGLRRLADACPTKAIADIFLLAFEWGAFCRFAGRKALGLECGLAPASLTPQAAWEQCWASPDAPPPMDHFAAAGRAIREAVSREQPSIAVVLTAATLYEARDTRRAAQATGSEAVAAWVEAWWRLRLALALLRCRLNGWRNVLGPEALDDLGPSKAEVVAGLSDERRDWRVSFARLGLASAEGVPEGEPRPAAAVERLIDNAVSELCHGARGTPFGPEPVFAFLWRLRIEAINLQSIVAGVAAGLPREAIAGTLREAHA